MPTHVRHLCELDARTRIGCMSLLSSVQFSVYGARDCLARMTAPTVLRAMCAHIRVYVVGMSPTVHRPREARRVRATVSSQGAIASSSLCWTGWYSTWQGTRLGVRMCEGRRSSGGRGQFLRVAQREWEERQR